MAASGNGNMDVYILKEFGEKKVEFNHFLFVVILRLYCQVEKQYQDNVGSILLLNKRE